MSLVRGVKLLLFIATIVASVLSCVVSASLSSQTEQLAFMECISYSCHHRILGQMLSGKNLIQGSLFESSAGVGTQTIHFHLFGPVLHNS